MMAANDHDPTPPEYGDGYLDALIAASPLQAHVPRGTKSEAEKPPAAIPPRELIDWQKLDGSFPPAMEWDVEHWIPTGKDTLLAGRGGIGKTLFAQCLATALGAGFDYCGEVNRRRKTLLWAGEDDRDELWRRQININREMKVTMADIQPYFHAISYCNADITLAANIFGAMGATPLLGELQEQVRDLGIDLVILDNIARIFGGNENDRHQVTQFMSWLRAAIQPAGLLLLGHPAKATTSEFSGSTAWEGAVRARLFISDRKPDAPEPSPDDIPDPKVRYIARRKANYAQTDICRMRLEGGVLIPDGPSEAAAAISPQIAADVVYRAIRILGERGIYGNHGTRSPDYLPKLAKQYNLLENITQGQFSKAMAAMIIDGRLIQQQVGQYPNRSPKMGLAIP